MHQTFLLIQVIINYCPIAVGVGDVVECAASLIKRVRLVSAIGGATGGSGNLSTIVYFFLVGGCARHLQNPATKCNLVVTLFQ
jgi:hypothetical protein